MGKNYNVVPEIPDNLLDIKPGEIVYVTTGGAFGIYRDFDYNFHIVEDKHIFSYIPTEDEIIPLLDEDATCMHHASGKLFMAYRGKKIIDYFRGDKKILQAILNDKKIKDAEIVEFNSMLEVMDFIKKNKLKN